MAAALPIVVAAVAAGIAWVGMFQWLRAKASRGLPADRRDMLAIEAALAGEGGRILRASLDRSGHLTPRNDYLEERTGERLYHVTMQIGSVAVRRRVSVRDDGPATILP
jgi:hypothetical protein